MNNLDSKQDDMTNDVTDDMTGDELDELDEQSNKAEKIIKEDKKKKVFDVKSNKEKTEKQYSESQVRQMLAQVMENKGEETEDDKNKTKTVRMPRIKNKFIIALKNMNDDEYTKHIPIYAYDIYDKNTKKSIPWVTLILEDNSELLVPFKTALNRSTKINCELVEVKKVDKSYDSGKVEKREAEDGNWNMKGTGIFVKAKISMDKYSYVVKLPDGKVIEVGDEIINW